MGICICFKSVKTDMDIINSKVRLGSLGREQMNKEGPRKHIQPWDVLHLK